jgi:hypothetical protein
MIESMVENAAKDSAGGLHRIHRCEVCGTEKLDSVLDLGPHPMCDDLVPVGDTRRCREYPIEILFCQRCRTGHQRFQVEKRELFPQTYHYRSRFTADVLSGMQALVGRCEDHLGTLAQAKVLDIGCNDGSLLDFFRQKDAITIGIEPTGAVEDAAAKGHLTYQAFLSEEVARTVAGERQLPDIITFTNVFAHIQDLDEVLKSLRILIGPKTLLVIENHYLGSVLDGRQFDTFYHEHPRTYSFTSFTVIARELGVEVIDVEFPLRYGGNIRVFLGNGRDSRVGWSARSDLLDREAKFGQRFLTMKEDIGRWRADQRRTVDELVRRHGLLRAKAFPGRAAILVKLLGLDETQISAVYEKPGSMKIGHYVPGSRIAIRSDDELFAMTDKSLPILNLAWHIAPEIRDYLTRNGYGGPVVDIVQAEDFAPSQRA